MKYLRTVAVAGAVAAVVLLASSRPAYATMDIMKSAKAAGVTEATNCAYCHNEKMPKKDGATENSRGEWLKAEKAKRKAAKIDAAWLKDYKPADAK
jgi:mono/diheme cytochrome c family protein